MPTARLEDIEAPASSREEVVQEPKPSADAEGAGAPDGSKPVHEWSSTQMNVPPEIAQAVLAFAQSIPAEKIVQGKDEGQGEPHVTVLYGIDSGDAAPVKDALEDAESVRIKFGKLGLFENDDADVLMIEVESPDIEALNRMLREEVPHVEKQIEYHPHLTVAYLKPGEGAEYVNKPVPGVTGKRMKLDTLRFTSKNGESTDIPLGEESPAKPTEQPAEASPTQAAA